MNTEALKKLAQNAKSYGEAYAAVKDDLIRRGVPKEEAIEAARSAANMAMMMSEDGEGPSWE